VHTCRDFSSENRGNGRILLPGVASHERSVNSTPLRLVHGHSENDLDNMPNHLLDLLFGFLMIAAGIYLWVSHEAEPGRP
jgi:hypothetical protein